MMYDSKGNEVDWSFIPMMGACDIETTGLDYTKERITLLQFGIDEGDLQWYSEDPTIEDIIELSKRTLFWHNGKFDTKFIAYHYGIMLPIHGDSLVLLHALGYDGRLKLKEAVMKLLGVPDWDIDDDTKLSKNLTPEGKLKLISYGLKDSKYTFALMRLLLTGVNSQVSDPTYNKNFNIIDDLQYNVYNNELKAYSAYRYIEMTGTPLGDINIAQSTIEKQITDIENKWGFRFDWVNSSDKVGELIALVEPRLKKGTNGKYSVTKDVLTDFIQEESDFVYDIKEVRKLMKLTQFFASWEKLGHDGRIFPQFNIATKTGRTSSSEPNLQQVPQNSLVRNVIAAPKGMKFIECDYSQLELRCAAYCAQEPSMIEAYKNGADLHSQTWFNMNNRPFSEDHDTAKRERTVAKAANFSLLYGAQASTLREYARSNMGLVMTEEEANEYHAAFFRSYPGLVKWHTACKNFVAAHGYIQSPLGRRRYLPDVYSNEWSKKQGAFRRSINTPVQGLGSDICVSAMTQILAHPEYGKTFFVHGTIHDAILVTALEDQAEHVAYDIIKYTMEHPPILEHLPTQEGLYIVADVDISDCWGG